MTPEQAKKPVDELRNRVKTFKDKLDDLETYKSTGGHGPEFVVNVKRTYDCVDWEYFIKLVEEKNGRKFSDEANSWLGQEIIQDDVCQTWLETEREYVVQGLFGGLALSSPAYWDQTHRQIDQGSCPLYPALQELRTNEERHKVVGQWAKNDEIMRQHLVLINKFEPGWLGRSSGYFCLGGAYGELLSDFEDIEDLFEALDEHVESMKPPILEVHLQEVMTLYEQKLGDAGQLVEEYEDLANAVMWFLEAVDSHNKSLDFKDELLNRVDNEIEEIKHQKILVYADEVEAKKRETDERTVLISTPDEIEKWDGKLYRYNDKEGDMISLLFYPNASPGHLGESEIFFVELPEENVVDFCKFLMNKRLECLAQDQDRKEQTAEDDATMEGY